MILKSTITTFAVVYFVLKNILYSPTSTIAHVITATFCNGFSLHIHIPHFYQSPNQE